MFSAAAEVAAQRINGEIFIPLSNRSEIWLKPKLDTLENGKEYEFRIRVSPEFTISQFLFEKGLAINNDSMLVIKANSTKYGDIDTATLRVIVTSIKGSRIMLFQRQFFVKVPEKQFPMISNPKINIIKMNDKVMLERNKPYPKDLFLNNSYVTMYDNEVKMNRLDVKKVTIALMEKEGKQYAALGDTLSNDAVREIKKIKDPMPIYIKVDGMAGKSKKSVWNRVILYAE
jgi:hypothetical protein